MCALGDDKWEFYSTADLLNHIAEHRAAGHHIPEGVIDSLREDQADNDAFIVSKLVQDNRENG